MLFLFETQASNTSLAHSRDLICVYRKFFCISPIYHHCKRFYNKPTHRLMGIWGGDTQSLTKRPIPYNSINIDTAIYPPIEKNLTAHKLVFRTDWKENKASLAFSSWCSLLTLSIWKLWLDWILSSCSRCFSSSPWNSFFFSSTAPLSAAALRTLPSSSMIRVYKDTTV